MLALLGGMRFAVGLSAPLLCTGAALGLLACGGEGGAQGLDRGPPGLAAQDVDGLFVVRGGRADVSFCDGTDRAIGRPARTCSTAGAPSTLALGVCGDLRADNTLTLRSPTQDAMLAVNGRSVTSAPLTVEGCFISHGSIDARNTQIIDGHLATAGDWTVSSPVTARRDAFVGGAIDARNAVTVEGTLHVGDMGGAGNVSAGAVELGPVSVTRPLACERAPRAGALADALLADRDAWATVHFGPDPSSRISEPTEVDLGCGRYLFDALEVNNTLTLRVRGDVVLVIDGRLRVAAPMNVDLDPDATLSVVIRDSLEIDNTLTIAAGRDPERTWMAVGGTVRVAAPFRLNGALVMPDSELQGDNTFDLRGQALVGSLRVAAPMNVELDAPDPALTCDD